MPDYDYQCSECGRSFIERESLDEHSANKQRECPGCGSVKIERVLSSVYVKTSRKA